ncbi:MAG TPA: M1 family metallopeptidase [Gemmatimonadaceae bacterium]|nr:M1 family metallopeptidase [Gemmatimonadaceae bacterium]
MRSIIVAMIAAGSLAAQTPQTPRGFSHADSLRGSNTPQRAWWDAAFYDLHVRVNPADSTISGFNGVTYRVLKPASEMQLDLQVPMQLDSVLQNGRRLTFRRDSNAFFVTLGEPQVAGRTGNVVAYFHGKPRAAKNPPWDGGFIWRSDSSGNRWVATANQGLGASVWWPNKDQQADEPDSQRVVITVPDPMVDVSNGRLRSTVHNNDGTTSFEWFVTSPINNYAISVNAGTYEHWMETYEGLGGKLTLDFWPLAEHLTQAKAQFPQARAMIACFESWFGPYPWYADGYKLVEAPHLGMEHQSAVAYGNGYHNGYRGRDLSATGEGLKWDFIIVHESAHEWWGNNITATDVADNWIHEGFANYAEGVFAECQDGKDAGAKYIIGSRRNIRNDGPIIGPYGVMQEGSGDMYYKGGSMLHTIRQIINDDERWKNILHGLQTTFGRKTASSAEVEAYISRNAGIDFSRVFDEYLRTTMVPVLEYRSANGAMSVRWTNVVPGFNMPVRVGPPGGAMVLVKPTTEWATVPVAGDTIVADENFYVTVKRGS